jgi:hypothetical protein
MASPPPEDLVELDTDVQASDQVTLSDEEQDEADQDESNQVAVGARGRGMGRSGKGGKGVHGGKGRGRGAGDAAPSEVGSTSSRKAVNKDLTGVKKQNKQFSRKCKGCGLYFKPEGMGSKSAFCVKDKHRLDALTRVAKAQGKLKWIKDVRKDEDKVSKVLKKYDELTGGTGALKSQA